MTSTINVAVLGARGRLGSAAVKAIEAADDMAVVATLGRGDDLSLIESSGATHVLDLTVPDQSEANVRHAVAAGKHTVVGTTGWDEQKRQRLQDLLKDQPEVGVMIAPNFAIGSVLASRFAAAAAQYFESVEIIELHHPNKVDAPSGTAIRTAEMISQARVEAGTPAAPDATETALDGARGADVESIPVHSVRLRGLTAHQEVLFGGAGETLTLRHDSFGHDSFMHGILLALRTVADRPGLAYGLDEYLDL
ncbi:4-hydroxy-tetrahydrodipicolinate reductase [Micrococcoides hystricis]|uniref:4-hydroxy-tetrahydrodipicolinate reductase n=1 Tax=Micrococcoides hystricis TaxID=1572761 RepID=A0ABV6P8M9_9MICC